MIGELVLYPVKELYNKALAALPPASHRRTQAQETKSLKVQAV